ncbi:MAG: YMGG-like glycine zipper-containing protein [Steroidobacteraceae bacterium]
MPSNTSSILWTVFFLVLVTTASAQAPPPQGKSLAASAGVFAYPTKGQKPDKQAQDEAECYNWSKQQSGYDPMSPPPPPAPAQAAEVPKSTSDGSRARGALRGAAAGAVIGEVAGNDAGKGAAIGATAGVLAGGRQNRMAQSQKQQQAEQQAQADAAQTAAAQQQLADAFKKGMSVCLEARGYTVK